MTKNIECKNMEHFYQMYDFYTRQNEYWKNYIATNIHEEQNKKYFVNYSQKCIETLINEYPEYAEAYGII